MLPWTFSSPWPSSTEVIVKVGMLEQALTAPEGRAAAVDVAAASAWPFCLPPSSPLAPALSWEESSPLPLLAK